MRRIFHILILAGAFFGFLGAMMHAQNSRSNPHRQHAVYPRLQKQFDQVSLNAAQLEVFSDRALEKLGDFIEYLNLIADGTLPADFREKARGMALALFVSEEVIFLNFLDASSAPGEIAVNELLRTSEGKDAPERPVLSLIAAKVLRPAGASEGGSYSGEIEFRLQCSFPKSGAEDSRRELQGRIPFTVVRGEKRFGDAVRQVWEAKLGG